MPLELKYGCSNCKYVIQAWEGYMYVKDEQGEMYPCGHPCEEETISDVLQIERIDAERWMLQKYEEIKPHIKELIDSRVGHACAALCGDCLCMFYLDLKTEERKCQECGGSDVKFIYEFKGWCCPRCKAGQLALLDIPCMS